MYEAELHAITKTDGNAGINYRVYLSVDYHGIEEEAVFHYESLKDIPRYLIDIKEGKPTYRRGLVCYVSHPFEDGNGLKFQYIYKSRS